MEKGKKLELKALIKKLSDIKGRGTELISLYVPKDYPLDKARSEISQEMGTAQNIKSKETRKSVIAALRTISEELKLYDETPENGMAVFCGDVGGESERDIEIWVIEPPVPLEIKEYKCDKTFLLEPLKKLIAPGKAYGMIIIDNRHATIGLVKGRKVIPRREMESNIPGKFRAGGQSAARFKRRRRKMKLRFYRRVGDEAKKVFEREEIKGLIIGGPGPTKEKFLQKVSFPKYDIIKTVSTNYTGKPGMKEALHKSENILEKEEIVKEKKNMEKFFTIMKKKPKFVVTGKEELMKSIKFGATKKVFLSEKLPTKELKEIAGKAESQGSEVILISDKTEEGSQFQELGGYGAILRFPI